MDGWLQRCKERNNIKFKKKQHGEKQDAADLSADRCMMEALTDIMKDCEQRNVLNADETGLYW